MKVPNEHILHVISPVLSNGQNGPIKSPVSFGGYEWFKVEFRACGILFKITIEVLYFQRPKSAVFQMSEIIESNLSFTLRLLKAYHENVLNC